MTFGTRTNNEIYNRLFWLSYHGHQGLFKHAGYGSQCGYKWQHRWVTSIYFPWQLESWISSICSKMVVAITHCLVDCRHRNLKYTMVYLLPGIWRQFHRAGMTRYRNLLSSDRMQHGIKMVTARTTLLMNWEESWKINISNYSIGS